MAHLGEVERRLAEVRDLGGELIAVSQARPERLAVHLQTDPRPFPVVCDPDRAAYRRFGLERGGWAMFFRPRVLAHYLRLVASGWRSVGPLAVRICSSLAATSSSTPTGGCCWRTAALTRRTGPPPTD
ncbi:MAG: hypothetical protein U0736_07370 [Gemmataceae bacterium]